MNSYNHYPTAEEMQKRIKWPAIGMIAGMVIMFLIMVRMAVFG